MRWNCAHCFVGDVYFFLLVLLILLLHSLHGRIGRSMRKESQIFNIRLINTYARLHIHSYIAITIRWRWANIKNQPLTADFQQMDFSIDKNYYRRCISFFILNYFDDDSLHMWKICKISFRIWLSFRDLIHVLSAQNTQPYLTPLGLFFMIPAPSPKSHTKYPSASFSLHTNTITMRPVLLLYWWDSSRLMATQNQPREGVFAKKKWKFYLRKSYCNSWLLVYSFFVFSNDLYFVIK